MKGKRLWENQSVKSDFKGGRALFETSWMIQMPEIAEEMKDFVRVPSIKITMIKIFNLD